jgi:hypothetical protein
MGILKRSSVIAVLVFMFTLALQVPAGAQLFGQSILPATTATGGALTTTAAPAGVVVYISSSIVSLCILASLPPEKNSTSHIFAECLSDGLKSAFDLSVLKPFALSTEATKEITGNPDQVKARVARTIIDDLSLAVAGQAPRLHSINQALVAINNGEFASVDQRADVARNVLAQLNIQL